MIRPDGVITFPPIEERNLIDKANERKVELVFAINIIESTKKTRKLDQFFFPTSYEITVACALGFGGIGEIAHLTPKKTETLHFKANFTTKCRHHQILKFARDEVRVHINRKV